MSTSPVTYVKVACHCGLNKFRAKFLNSDLPISNDLCHCNTCRHCSGQLAVYHVSTAGLFCLDSDEPFRVDTGESDDRSSDRRTTPDGDLVAYQTSNHAMRYFCAVCSAQLIFRSLGKPVQGGEPGEREGGHFAVAVGALEKTEGVVYPGYHIWVEDTLDGGLADHFRSFAGVELPRYRRDPKSETLPVGWRAPSLGRLQKPLQDGSASSSDEQETLPFSCHCRAVRFKITRPNASSALFQAPYPDILHPYDTTHLAKIRNSEDVKWWLRPLGSSKPTKYFTGHCVCPCCRLTSGFEIQSWAFVPIDNILDEDGNPITLQEKDEYSLSSEEQYAINSLNPVQEKILNKDLTMPNRPAGLRQYISSAGRYREFCGTCGATAFAWYAGQPNLVSVAAALVDEEVDGARAESWFEWCLDRVAFSYQAITPGTVESLVAGMKAMKETVAKREGKELVN